MKGSKNQYLCTLILSIPSFVASFGVVWPSYTIATLDSDHTPLNHKITKQDADLIGSLPMLGSFVITLVVGYISDRYGRKKSQILCGLFFTVSWALTTTAKLAIQIIISRVFFGFGMGIHFAVSIIYTGEVAEQSIRGVSVSFMMFMYSMGTLASYLAGWFCSFHFICYLNLSLSVLSVVLIVLMKETPAYLISKGKDNEALKSLRFYRAASTTTEDLLDELNYIKSQRASNKVDSKLEKSLQIDNENEKLNHDNDTKEEKEMSAWKMLLTSKSTQREIVILSVITVLTMFMGMLGVQTYAGRFFSMAAPDISPHLCSVLLALVLSLASGVAASISDLFGRRILMITSTSLATLSLALLGLQLRWTFAPSWMVPLLVVFYCISYQLGANNIPLVQANECFRPEVRSLGMQLILSCVCMANFFLLLIFNRAVQYIGLDGTFFVFSLIGAILTIIVILFMRETRGVPLEVVQEMFEQYGYLYRTIDINNKKLPIVSP